MATMTAPKKTAKIKSTSQDASKAKKEQVLSKIRGVTLLGEIITWSAKADVTHTYKAIVQALTDAELDPKIAKEILPRHAFGRAAKKLAEERVIDVLKEGDDDIVFQFTKKTMASSNGKSEDELDREWLYKKEVTLRLNKLTGKVQCEDKNLQDFAEKEVARHIEERNTSDITKIVQTLFENNADLFSIRDQGGAYFVPVEHIAFIDKVQEFLENRLGGRINRFPVPAGSTHGDRAVATSIADNLNSVVLEHQEAIESFNIHTRADTMENAATRIKETRVKVEAYAHYLHSKREELIKALDEADENLRKQIEGIAHTKATAQPGTQAAGTRAQLWGHSITAIIRWMGKPENGYNFEKCQKALAKHGITVADATIRAQLLAGRKNERGDPADLTKEQAKELEV